MFWRRLHRLLPILAIMGLIAGPFTAPVNALTVAAMKDVSMSAMAGGEMAGEMPCCPDGTPAVPDCQKSCPLMATCMAKCATAVPMLSPGSVAFRAEVGALRPASDVMGDALAVAPPARPPRT